MTLATKKPLRLLALTCLVIISFLFDTASSQAVEIRDAKVKSYENGDDLRADVPKTLKWPRESLAAAGAAQKVAAKNLQAELNLLEQAGAVRINKVFEAKAKLPKSWSKYLPEVRKFHLVGVDGLGNTLKVSRVFPAKGAGVATLLVGLTEESCKIGESNFLDFSTWFLNSCKISKGSPKDFLRIATREAHLKVDQTELAANVQFYWMQLEGCLLNGYEFTITGNIFNCPENQRGFYAHEFNLRSLTGMGGYEFKVDENAKTATIRYLAPDYLEFAKGVAHVPGTPNLKFRQPLVLEAGMVP
jgi:hypothetical protein